MSGISSQAAGKLENNGIEFEHKEFSDGSGLEEYAAFYRDLDPQIGRWWQIDPKVDEMYSWSPYTSNFDDPIFYADIIGDWPEWLKSVGQAVAGFAVGTVQGAVGVVKGVVTIATRPTQTVNAIIHLGTHPLQAW